MARSHAGGGIGWRGRNTPAHEVYDPAANRWTALAYVPTARDHLAAAAMDGRVYAVGGRIDGNYSRNLTLKEPFGLRCADFTYPSRPRSDRSALQGCQRCLTSTLRTVQPEPFFHPNVRPKLVDACFTENVLAGVVVDARQLVVLPTWCGNNQPAGFRYKVR
jgi:hypothetical protein